MNPELRKEVNIMLANPAWGYFKDFCNAKAIGLFEQAVSIDTVNELMRQQQLIGAAGEIRTLADSFETSVRMNETNLQDYE